MVKWFPELKALQHFAEPDDVGETSTHFQGYLRSLKGLILTCGCCDCHLAATGVIKSGAQDKGELRACLVTLTEMIIVLCHYLAQAVLESAFHPTVQGLRTLYRAFHCHTHYRPQPLDERAEYYESLLRQDFGHHTLVKGYSQAEMYFILFTGYLPPERMNWRRGRRGDECATSWHGICVYRETLLALSDQYSQASRVHIIAGFIEAGGRTCDTVQDGIRFTSDYPHASPFRMSSPDTFNSTEEWTPELNAELVVENIDILRASWRLHNLWIFS